MCDQNFLINFTTPLKSVRVRVRCLRVQYKLRRNEKINQNQASRFGFHYLLLLQQQIHNICEYINCAMTVQNIQSDDRRTDRRQLGLSNKVLFSTLIKVVFQSTQLWRSSGHIQPTSNGIWVLETINIETCLPLCK